MSFLKPQPGTNPAAEGLGRLLGTDASRIGSWADRIGNGMNMIAGAGGAQPGYMNPVPPVANHMQMIDPNFLQSILRRFRPTTTGIQYP